MQYTVLYIISRLSAVNTIHGVPLFEVELTVRYSCSYEAFDNNWAMLCWLESSSQLACRVPVCMYGWMDGSHLSDLNNHGSAHSTHWDYYRDVWMQKCQESFGIDAAIIYATSCSFDVQVSSESDYIRMFKLVLFFL